MSIGDRLNMDGLFQMFQKIKGMKNIFIIWKYFYHLKIFPSFENISIIWKHFHHLKICSRWEPGMTDPNTWFMFFSILRLFLFLFLIILLEKDPLITLMRFLDFCQFIKNHWMVSKHHFIHPRHNATSFSLNVIHAFSVRKYLIKV